MSSITEKGYHIDNEPASSNDIIELAESYSKEFADDWCKQTSVAAKILRENGHIVGELKKEREENIIETSND